jgi:hydrogenase maturation protease
VELARALGRLPPRLVFFGIEGACFDAGETLTPAVAAAVEQLDLKVGDEVATFRWEARD